MQGPLYFLSDHFLSGEARVHGSEGGRVRILELSSTTGRHSGSIVSFLTMVTSDLFGIE